jgi:TatD DNase family protein
MLIDIHTHNLKTENDGEFRLIVGKNSLGIHPWELNASSDLSYIKKRFEELSYALSKDVLAIGECGLDRKRSNIHSIADQLEVLSWHLDWSMKEKMPIIIHCVRSFSDLLQVLKAKKHLGKILIHDFSGNQSEASSLLKYDCYFSFGYKLFNDNSSVGEMLRKIPLERVFLETDDQIKYSIMDIYKKAALLLDLDFFDLEKILEENLSSFFSDLNNVRTSDIIKNKSFGQRGD